MDAQPEFETWYLAEHPRLVAVLVRLGTDRHGAAEVAAEAFSRAFERWTQVGAMGSPTGWTYQVAFNLQRRRARRAAFEAQVLRRHRPVHVPPPGGEIWSAVSKLPDRQRQAVVLHYLLDLPYKDVAQAMGIAEGTVAATLTAARRALAGALDDGESDGELVRKRGSDV